MRPRHPLRRLAWWAALAAGAAQAEPADLFALEFEQLLDLRVTSVSRSEETLAEAPAQVRVLTRQDLRDRGYRELSEIFDDLPGIDVTRSHGDNSYVAYWRGIRQQVGIPYRVLVDGLPLNHLFYNHAHVLPALPMRMIERVEVVYGPASVSYGANALVGVVNIVTRAAPAADGRRAEVALTAGQFATRTFDAYAAGRRGDSYWMLGARVAQREFDDSHVDLYEYTRRDYLADPQLWGGLLEDPRYGEFRSEARTRGIDLRLGHGDTEFGIGYLDYTGGFGVEYATDRTQPNAQWSEPDLAAHLRRRWQWSDRLSGSSLLRWRSSAVDEDSDFVDAGNLLDAASGRLQRRIGIDYYRIDSRSLLLQQDLDYRASDRLQLTGGLSHERQHLQRVFAVSAGPRLLPDQIAGSYPLPATPARDLLADNFVDTRDTGLYLLGRYRLDAGDTAARSHTLHLGARRDDDSQYGSVTSLRGGYVWQHAPWRLKLLYGEGFLEPPPSVAYGRTSAGQPIQPITTRTVQLNLGYAGERLNLEFDLYRLRSDGAFGGTRLDRFRVGDTSAHGVDAMAEYRFAPAAWGELRVWGYASWLDAEQTRRLASGATLTEAPGDMAETKLWAGLSWEPRPGWRLTLRGRRMAARDTVFSNPVGRIPGYTTADLNLLLRDLGGKPLDLGIAVQNLGDRGYVQPGIRNASAGTTPGRFDADGVWRGSAALGNSMFPQEGRGVFLTLSWHYD